MMRENKGNEISAGRSVNNVKKIKERKGKKNGKKTIYIYIYIYIIGRV
jgi:hypothetical protein